MVTGLQVDRENTPMMNIWLYVLTNLVNIIALEREVRYVPEKKIEKNKIGY